jgi:rubrerythrin
MANHKLIDILKSAILLEVRGETFYRKVASGTENAGVKKIFSIMADEEVLHASILREKYKEVVKDDKLSDSGFPVNTEDVNAAGYVLSEAMRNQISGAGFEAAAISAAIDMETKAIKLYSESAENTSDANEKILFNWLADWERGHHKLLYELDRDLKERIWNDNNFWPF